MHTFPFFWLQCSSTQLQGVVSWSSRAWKHLNNGLDNGQLVSMSFKKSRNDTYLRLTWSSNTRQWRRLKCSQWYFKINNKECTIPATIDGVLYQDINRPNGVINDHRHTTIVGVCKATSSGSLQSSSYQVSMNVRDCPGASPGADAYSGWISTSTMIVEELCPPQ